MNRIHRSSNNLQRIAPVLHTLERRVFLCAELHGTASGAAERDGAAVEETLYETAARPAPTPTPGFGFAGAFRAGGAYGDGGRSVATDAAGNLYVAGIAGTATSDAGYVAKYSPQSALLWSAPVDGHVAVDTAGDVYVSGAFEGTMTVPGAPDVLTSAGGTDVFVVKLSGADGTAIWARRFGGADSDDSRGIVVDAAGAYYIATVAPAVTGGSAIRATKFDAAGNEIYSSLRATASANPETWPTDIALDPTGGVVVVGQTFSSNAPRPSFAWKVDAGGAEQWDRQWAGAVNTSYILAGDVAVDGAGNVLIAGSFTGAIDFNPSTSAAFTLTSGSCRDAPGGIVSCPNRYAADAFVLKLDAAGTFAWAGATGGGERGDDGANDLATDAGGNVYTTGRFYGKADFDPGAGRFEITAKGVRSTDWLFSEYGVSDAFISKLDAAGKFVWATAVGGSDSTSTGDTGSGIAVGDDGRVHTTGFFVGSGDFDPTAGVRTLTSAGQSDLFLVSLTQPAAAAGTGAGGAFTGRGFGAAGTMIGAEASAEHDDMRRQSADELEALLR